jgi:hypothetical protein
MAATPATADGVLVLRNVAKPTTLLLLGQQGNASNNGLLTALGGANLCASTQGGATDG